MNTSRLYLHIIFLFGFRSHACQAFPFESSRNNNQPPFTYHERIVTLGDLGTDRVAQNEGLSPFDQQKKPYQVQKPSHDRPRALHLVMRDFIQCLHKQSPALSGVTLASMLVYLLWQVPPVARNVLRDHFICNKTNVLGNLRFDAMLFSAVSHSSFRHLFINLYAYITLGGDVCNALKMKRLNLWPFVIGAALFGSLFSLVAQPGFGSLGLSGVTLAMLAFVARQYPTREFSIFFFPRLRICAEHILILLLAGSAFGVLTRQVGEVSHGTHLGGLLFGCLYFEACNRGWLLDMIKPHTTTKIRTAFH